MTHRTLYSSDHTNQPTFFSALPPNLAFLPLPLASFHLEQTAPRSQQLPSLRGRSHLIGLVVNPVNPTHPSVNNPFHIPLLKPYSIHTRDRRPAEPGHFLSFLFHSDLYLSSLSLESSPLLFLSPSSSSFSSSFKTTVLS